MTISASLFDQISAAQPGAKVVAREGDTQITVAVQNIEQIGCALDEISVTTTRLAGGGFRALSDWAANLCSRLTYLIEGLQPIENDQTSGRILVRSAEPHRQDGVVTYFEAFLKLTGDGAELSLKRYEKAKSATTRDAKPMQLTREVAARLADDLFASIPS